jgi:GntR family transcriptional regulator/MocR family aminotransferase
VRSPGPDPPNLVAPCGETSDAETRGSAGEDALDHVQPLKSHELLVEFDRASREPLRRQLERALRAGIEDGSLPGGARLPSSRSLAEQLGVSRGVVVDAYEQLTAQGFLLSHQRKAPIVCAGESPSPAPPRPVARYRFVLNPTSPDLSLFPRRLWLQATAEAMRDLPNQELDYPPDWRGPVGLRTALAGYLSRVRRVRVDLDRLILTLGFLHSLDLVCRVLALRGARRVAVENPSIPEQAAIARGHGLEVVPIPVDHAGLVVRDLFDTEAEAVIVTPAHQFPLGTVLSPERRRAIASWASERRALVVENDYDAEFRYDGPPIGAVQGLAPERTVYVGTASKTLAPAVRLGWIVAPAEIAGALADLQFDRAGGFVGLNGQVFAHLVLSGAYERHVQRCRRNYRRRRDALVETLTAELPQLRVLGIAGGLHLTLRLPPACDADRVVETVRSEGIDIRSLSYYYATTPVEPEPGMVLGYGRLPRPSVPGVVHALARALDAAAARPTVSRG